MNDLIVITGQTTTGKTKLAIEYAKKYNGELVNADSRQIYKHLDIITGKDKKEIERQHVKIHLLDLLTPDEPFSSFDYIIHATIAVHDIWKRNKTPIIVGGTYLYIKHLLYGQDIKVPPNQELRQKLEKLSLEDLQKKLLSLDKSSSTTINNSDWNNPRRLIRKIEILTAQGAQNKGSTSEVGQRHSSEVKFDKLQIIGLKHSSKEKLIKAVRTRVENRLKEGAVEEVNKLLNMDYKETDPGLQTIGYRQIIQFLKGDISQDEAIGRWILKETQYAKRQYTFMKQNQYIRWKNVV